MADVTYFKLEMEEVTKQRAESVGMDYNAVLEGCGVTQNVFDTSKRLYKVHSKRDGLDPTAEIGAMKTDNYNRLCIGFMLKPETYRVDEPPKLSAIVAAVASAPVMATPYADTSDLRLAIDNLAVRQETTNKILGEIRSALSANLNGNADILNRMDKAIARLNEIENHTTHLADTKKETVVIKKAVTSIDQRISGINQIVASARIDISKIKSFLERFASGK